MRCCLGFSVKDMCGGKFYCMLYLEVMINGVRRFIYLLFQRVWWRFGKVCVMINLYFQGFLQGVDDGSVLIVKVLLVWGVQRVGRKECWLQEVQLCALILAYGSIFIIQALYMEGVVSNIFYYFECPTDLIAKILDSARVGIGLDLNMRFENISNFEVLGWDEIRFMKFTMASAVFFNNNF